MPELPANLATRLAEIERRLDDLSTARRLVSSSIGAGGLRIADGGSIAVDDNGTIDISDSDGNLRVQITAGEITVRDETGLIRWQSGAASIATLPPDPAIVFTSSTSWTTVATFSYFEPADYIFVGFLFESIFDAQIDVRLLDDTDGFTPEVVAQTTLIGSAQTYGAELQGQLATPVGEDWHRIQLQVLSDGSSVAITPLAARWS